MIDIYKINPFIKYKIQDNIYPIYSNSNLLYKTVKLVLFNQIIINPIFALILYNLNKLTIIFFF